MILRWAGPARQNLIHIVEFIAADDAVAALAVIDRIEQAAQRVREFPFSGREGAMRGTRELVIPGLPYIIIYRVRDPTIDVLRVLHAARQWPPA